MSKRPNFLVFYLDDLGYGDLGCQGSDLIRTPYIDSLAADGTRFTNWYASSPVCSPSRASLLTGRCPTRAGVPHILEGERGTPGLAPDEISMATLLRDAGYNTGMFGKWHLGVAEECRPNAHGFDEFYGFLAGCIDYYSHIFYWCMAGGSNPVHDLWHNEEEVWNNGRYFTEDISEKSVKWLRDQRSEDDPFFLYVPYNAPHYPMHAPQEYLDRYPDASWDRQIMAAMVSAVDDSVGAIITELKRQGIYDDTVIFFSSDNGPSTEDRNWLDGTEDYYYGGSAGVFRGHKGSLFEGGIREPAIITWKDGMPSGQVSDETCGTIDVMPTFFEIAGVEMPADRTIDGISVLPVIRDGAKTPHEKIFWDYADQLAVREGDWKLVLDGKLDFSRSQPDPVHLSNLADDPGERVNLVNEKPELAARLSAEVREWQASITAERGE